MIVLDTHALVWWLNDDVELGRKAKQAIQRELKSGEIIVSAISIWEIAMLVQRNRLLLSIDLASWISALGKIDGVRIANLDPEIAMNSVNLPGEFHQDPADRLIVATTKICSIVDYQRRKDSSLRSRQYDLVGVDCICGLQASHPTEAKGASRSQPLEFFWLPDLNSNQGPAD